MAETDLLRRVSDHARARRHDGLRQHQVRRRAPGCGSRLNRFQLRFTDKAFEKLRAAFQEIGEILSPCSDNDEITILDFAKEVIELTGSQSEIMFKDLPADDPKVRQPDISKAKSILEWSPQVDRKEGLRRTLEFFQDQELAFVSA